MDWSDADVDVSVLQLSDSDGDGDIWSVFDEAEVTPTVEMMKSIAIIDSTLLER